MSQGHANAVLRVLEGKTLAYTVTVHKPDGKKIEFQTDAKPFVKFDDDTRRDWIMVTGKDYSNSQIMEWERGMILLVEKNPDAVVSPS